MGKLSSLGKSGLRQSSQDCLLECFYKEDKHKHKESKYRHIINTVSAPPSIDQILSVRSFLFSV